MQQSHAASHKIFLVVCFAFTLQTPPINWTETNLSKWSQSSFSVRVPEPNEKKNQTKWVCLNRTKQVRCVSFPRQGLDYISPPGLSYCPYLPTVISYAVCSQNMVYVYIVLDTAFWVVPNTGKLLITCHDKTTICCTHLKYHVWKDFE